MESEKPQPQTADVDDSDKLLGGSCRTSAEFSAKEGETTLRMHECWSPPDDCEHMNVPEMLLHIYKHRRGHAVAPNGHTCPFLSLEEWDRIADWARSGVSKPRIQTLTTPR